MSEDKKKDDDRLGRLSMHPLGLEDALRDLPGVAGNPTDNQGRPTGGDEGSGEQSKPAKKKGKGRKEQDDKGQ